jgi:hypothetical protein
MEPSGRNRTQPVANRTATKPAREVKAVAVGCDQLPESFHGKGSTVRVRQTARGYGTLPMARHDPDALFSPAAVRSFERFVAVEEELLALLRDRLRQDREMLGGMRRAA